MISLRKDNLEMKNQYTIKNLVSNLQNKETKLDKQATRLILKYIHFYLRKVRHLNPKKYTRNKQDNSNDLQECDFEDLIQYIFLYILEKTNRIDLSYNENQIRAYLNGMIRIAYTLWWREKNKDIHKSCISLNTPIKSMPESDIEIQDVVEDLHEKSTPEIECAREEIKRQVQNLINLLPPTTARAMRLKYVHNMTFEEIGKVMGISAQRAQQITGQCEKALTSKEGPIKKNYKKAKAYYLKLKNAL